MTDQGKQKKKIFLIVGLALVLLGTGYYYFSKYISSPDLANKLKQKLIELADQKSNGLYKLNIGSIEVEGNAVSAIVKNISLSIDSAVLDNLIQQKLQPSTIYTFTLESLSLTNADIMAFLSTKTASLNKIVVSKGSVNITRILKSSDLEAKKAPKKKIQELVNKSVDKIEIDTLLAENIDIVYTNLNKRSRTTKNVYLNLYQLVIDRAAVEDRSRIFLSKKMQLSLDSIQFPLADKTYQLGAEKCLIAVGDSSISRIQNLYLRSQKGSSLEKLAAGMDVQKDVYALKIKEILIVNIDLPSLLEDSSFVADRLILKDPEFSVYQDKSKAPSKESKVGKYPHQLIRKLPFPLKLVEILIQGGTISYAEKNKNGLAIGKILFSQVNGKIGPINTRPEPTTIHANFNAMFMNNSAMDVKFDFPPSNNGQFSVSARFSPFPLTQINDAVLPLGNTRIKEGKITKLIFNINGNDNAATGTTLLNYEHLNVEIMKTKNEAGYEKNKLLSAAANTFFLHENNLAGDKNKDAFTVTYKRVPNKSFFNLIWKTVFFGIKANTGIGAMGKDKDRARIH